MTELGQSHDFGDHIAMVAFMLAVIAISGTIQLHMLNLVMKYYDQLEAIPIYQTAVMIMWFCTGLIVFDEARFYSSLELLGIFGSSCLCCIGINFLMMKTKMLKEARREELDIVKHQSSKQSLLSKRSEKEADSQL